MINESNNSNWFFIFIVFLIYNFFANRIFKAKPQSPLTYLTELQSKYKNNGIEGHQKLLKKLKVIAKRQRKALKSKIQHDNEPTDPFAN